MAEPMDCSHANVDMNEILTIIVQKREAHLRGPLSGVALEVGGAHKKCRS